MRHRSVRIDADDFPEMARQVLRGLEFESFAERDEEGTVRRERQPAAEMIGSFDLWSLAEDDLQVLERLAVQSAARHGCARAAFAGLRIGQVDKLVGEEVGIERDVEEAALAFGLDLRHTREGLGDRTVRTDNAKRTHAFGHQHPAVGQENHAPRVVQALCNRLDRERTVLGIDRFFECECRPERQDRPESQGQNGKKRGTSRERSDSRESGGARRGHERQKLEARRQGPFAMSFLGDPRSRCNR